MTAYRWIKIDNDEYYIAIFPDKNRVVFYLFLGEGLLTEEDLINRGITFTWGDFITLPSN